MDPRSPQNDAPTADDARDAAREHILSYADSVADWLAKACDTPAGREPLDVSALTEVEVISGTPALLMAVLMTGNNNTQALRAVYRLRELAAMAFRVEIDGRTASILAGAAS